MLDNDVLKISIVHASQPKYENRGTFSKVFIGIVLNSLHIIYSRSEIVVLLIRYIISFE